MGTKCPYLFKKYMFFQQGSENRYLDYTKFNIPVPKCTSVGLRLLIMLTSIRWKFSKILIFGFTFKWYYYKT